MVRMDTGLWKLSIPWNQSRWQKRPNPEGREHASPSAPRRSARVRVGAVLQRGADFRAAASVRAHGDAALGRQPTGVERVDGVLPGGAAGGLPLRAPPAEGERPEAAGADPWPGAARSMVCAASAGEERFRSA